MNRVVIHRVEKKETVSSNFEEFSYRVSESENFTAIGKPWGGFEHYSNFEQIPRYFVK